MGIRFACPNGHNLNVKEHLAGKRGICPNCGAKFTIPEAPTNGSPPGETGSRQPAQAAPALSSPARFTPPSDANTGGPPPSSPGPAVAPALGGAGPPADPPPPRSEPAPVVVPPMEGPAEAPSVVPLESIATELPVEAAPVAQYVAHRRRARHAQKTIAIFLFLMVLVLAVVLVWVLTRNPQTPPPVSSRPAPPPADKLARANILSVSSQGRLP